MGPFATDGLERKWEASYSHTLLAQSVGPGPGSGPGSESGSRFLIPHSQFYGNRQLCSPPTPTSFFFLLNLKHNSQERCCGQLAHYARIVCESPGLIRVLHSVVSLGKLCELMTL